LHNQFLGWTSASELVQLKSKLLELVEVYSDYYRSLNIQVSGEDKTSVEALRKDALLERFLALSSALCMFLKGHENASDLEGNVISQSAGAMQSSVGDESAVSLRDIN
jgi:hypothetical protein